MAFLGSGQGVGNTSAETIDTTSATLIVVGVVGDAPSISSDSTGGNTYAPGTEYTNSGGTKIRLWYCTGANLVNKSATHSFTCGVSYNRILAMAFDGGEATLLGQGNASDGGFTVNAVNAGNINPGVAGALMVAMTNFGNTTSGFAIDSSYVLAEAQQGEPSISYGGGIAYKIKGGGDSAAENPQFTWSGSAVRAEGGSMAFSLAGGGGGGGLAMPPRRAFPMSILNH